jgi:hypothetical protein
MADSPADAAHGASFAGVTVTLNFVNRDASQSSSNKRIASPLQHTTSR